MITNIFIFEIVFKITNYIWLTKLNIRRYTNVRTIVTSFTFLA